MSSFFNLTLDTLAPQGVTLRINNGAEKTGSLSVTLAIGCSDADKTGYQMKVWGDIGDETLAETLASWEAYSASKTVSLTSGDGTKSVKIKIRDSVLNESVTVAATIELDTAVPTVSLTYGPDVTRISKVSGADVCTFSFTSDEPFVEYRVMVVDSTTTPYDEGNAIYEDNGSSGLSGTGEFAADEEITVKINALDYADALSVGTSAVEKLGIVKVFVNDGVRWSE